MKNNKGFTLMEILLAAMIVGLIGIALAALTTSGVREGGVGRTRAMLRNQLSIALRQLRQDIMQSSSAQISTNGYTLTLTQQYPLGPDHTNQTTITYTFTVGSESGAGGGTIGGTLSRNGEVILQNVKSISDSTRTYPSFRWIVAPNSSVYSEVNSEIGVRIIVEVASDPVVNDVVEEVFTFPQGLPINKN